MKNLIAFGLVFSFLSFTAGSVTAAQSAVEWPDYSKWQVVQKSLFISKASNKELMNDYMTVQLLIGTATVHVDNREAPRDIVIEIDVLGNGAVLRQLASLTPFGQMTLDTQMLINGKWVSGKKERGLKVYADSSEALLKEGKLVGVLLVLESLESGKPPLELRLKNKEKRP